MSGDLSWLWPLFLLLATLGKAWKSQLFLLGVALLCFVWTKERLYIPEKNLEGQITLSFNKVSYHPPEQGPATWTYQGRATLIQEGKTLAKNLPVNCLIPAHKEQPDPDGSYRFLGKLSRLPSGQWKCIKEKEEPWQCIEEGWCLKWRMKAQSRLKEHLSQQFQDRDVTNLLIGLALGQSQDQVLLYLLSRVGLQHLLAVSGFHFSLLLLFLSTLLLKALSFRTSYLLAWVLLSGYYFFLGNSPSVFRAWLMIGLAIIALLLQRWPLPLNHLGAALTAALLLDPWMTEHLGFQLSFLITASILLFCPLWSRALCTWIPIPFLAKALGLLISVQLAALPLTVMVNGYFTLGSIVYNFFMPALFSSCLLLLGLGLATTPLPSLSHLFHQANELYTGSLLSLLDQPPAFLTTPLFLNVPDSLLFFCSSLFLLGLHAKLISDGEEVAWIL